jgi:hypothetical protein
VDNFAKFSFRDRIVAAYGQEIVSIVFAVARSRPGAKDAKDAKDLGR